MMQEIRRESENQLCLWISAGQKILSSWDEIYRLFDIQGVIRIHEKDYVQFPSGDIFTHFNLETCHHVPGKIYALPKIIIPGFFSSSGKEQLPLLDFSKCYTALCLAVREKVPYEQLIPEDFTHSFLHIRNTQELKKEILWRYKRSLPNLSDEALISLGVSITTLKLVQKLD